MIKFLLTLFILIASVLPAKEGSTWKTLDLGNYKDSPQDFCHDLHGKFSNCEDLFNTCEEYGYRKIAYHKDIKDAFLVYGPVDVAPGTGPIYSWTWTIEHGPNLWVDLFKESLSGGDYGDLCLKNGLNPDWDNDLDTYIKNNTKVSYTYPFKKQKQYKVISVKEKRYRLGHTLFLLNSKNEEHQKNMDSLINDKNVKDIWFSGNKGLFHVFFKEEYYQAITKTVEVK